MSQVKKGLLPNLEINDSVISKTLQKTMVPTILSILGTTLVSFVNSLLVGRFMGGDSLTAMNLGSTVTFIYACLGCLIGIGGMNMVSLAMGEAKKDRIKAIASLSLILSLALPLLVSVILLIFFDPFVQALGARDELYVTCAPYLKLLICGGVLTTFMYFPFNFLRGEGRAKDSLWMFGVLTITDFALVAFSIIKNVGMEGIGYSILLSTFLADALGFAMMLRPEMEIKFGKIKDVKTILKGIWTMGGAAGINNLCNFFRTMFLNSVIYTFFGKAGLSQLAVVCAILNFATAFVAGIGQSVSPLIGFFYGEKEYISIGAVIKRAVKTGIIMHSIIFLITGALSMFIAKAFGMEGDSVKTTAVAISLVMASLIIGAVNNIYIFYYMSIKENLIASTLTIARAFVFVALFVIILLQYKVGVFVYGAFLFAEIFTRLLNLLLCRIVNHKNPERKGLLLIDEKLENPDGVIAFTSALTSEGAADSSQKIAAFLEEKEADMKIQMMLPLALEEMLVIMDEHCYPGQEKGYADVRILLNERDVILRLRCDGKSFDPIAYYNEKKANCSEEELLMDDSLGIGMIVSEAKSVEFTRTLGINNLIIRFV